MIKLIKNNQDYEAALNEARRLVVLDPDPGSAEGDQLELLTFLIETWEEQEFPLHKPDPLAAIRFRMDQQGLKQKDLIPLIGSKSKVSEVLSGKQPLTLKMIRKLHQTLQIPLDVLISEEEPDQDIADLNWERFPIREMAARGWLKGFQDNAKEAADRGEELLTEFFRGVDTQVLQGALCRQIVRTNGTIDAHALIAWKAQVLKEADRQAELPPYHKGQITKAYITDIAKLSYLQEGPCLVQEYLAKAGIHFIVLEHLAKTHLDGAVMKSRQGAPVIALTLRYDRLDNFWFTLAHELAHVALHIDKDDVDCIIDDLDAEGDDKERAADELAREALLPARIWDLFEHKDDRDQINKLADRLRIHPAIIAGRIRWERRNYRILSDLVGNKQVRKLFQK